MAPWTNRCVAVEPQPGTRPLPVAVLGDHRLSQIDTRWVDNLQAGPLLVVSGRLRGVGGLPLEALELTLLDAQGVRWALDLGSDNYNMPGYFGSKRWTYYRMTNRSHNTLEMTVNYKKHQCEERALPG